MIIDAEFLAFFAIGIAVFAVGAFVIGWLSDKNYGDY